MMNNKKYKNLNLFRKMIKDNEHFEDQKVNKLLKILSSENKKIKTSSKLISLDQVRDWKKDRNGNIYHKSKQFFSIEGVRTKMAKNREVKEWDQPILNQLHGGVLAIIAKKTLKNGIQFLLRIRIEPGDDGKLKYCPTFQATKSNVNRAHGGKKPLFFDEIFKNKNTEIIFNTTHSEEGGRFWKKKNQNMLLLTKEKYKLEKISDDCIWMTLSQIKQLALKDNIINPFVKTILFMI